MYEKASNSVPQKALTPHPQIPTVSRRWGVYCELTKDFSFQDKLMVYTNGLINDLTPFTSLITALLVWGFPLETSSFDIPIQPRRQFQ